MSSPYDHLRKVLSDNDSVFEDPYPDLKQLLPVDMVTFAYQIADGMVSNVLAMLNVFEMWPLACTHIHSIVKVLVLFICANMNTKSYTL